jgi:uncharacterized protein (DUF1501 family)
MKRSRRNFLRDSACGITAAAMASSLERLNVINAMVQPQPDVASDYKALVCVFLNGGSDCNNMVIPFDDYNGGYNTVRGSSGLAVPLSALSATKITPANSGGVAYALHPNLSPEANNAGQAAGLLGPWNQGKLAILCNYGSLLQPTTKAQYQSNVNGAFRPYQLFSHSDQVNQQMTSICKTTGQTGWGGRVADSTGSLNGVTVLPMSISIAGTSLFETGLTSRQLAIGTGTLSSVLNLNWNGPSAVNPFNSGSSFRQLLGFDTNTALTKGASDTMNQALNADQTLNQPDPTLTAVFPASNIGDQLKQVAKLIKLGNTPVANGGLGMHRQIFFCSLGGFDTHTNETSADPTNPANAGGQGNLLTQFSQAARAFYDEMTFQGNSNSVTLFSLSDFGRTFQPSGSGAGSVGSDHAWGSHAFIMGGSVVGGRFYGTYPTLALNSNDDDGGGRGRWIPTTSIDQYGATLAAWYGLPANLLTSVFPNLSTFPTQTLSFLG